MTAKRGFDLGHNGCADASCEHNAVPVDKLPRAADISHREIGTLDIEHGPKFSLGSPGITLVLEAGGEQVHFPAKRFHRADLSRPERTPVVANISVHI